MKKFRVLALMREEKVPPADVDSLSDKDVMPFKTELHVLDALRDLGHEVRALGVYDDVSMIRQSILAWKPHIVFNLLEDFIGLGTYVPFVLGYLELMRIPYTGCNPRGLILTDNKALMRKILRHHRIPMPDFAAVPRGRKPRRPKRLSFPLIVKSSTEHGSVGISQASIVNSDEKLAERVRYVHEKVNSDAIVEQYIEGRELYMGVIGHHRLETLPIWEMSFEKLAEGAPNIATEKAKWDLDYQERVGLTTGPADLDEETRGKVIRLCKRVYRILELSAYARVDLRLTEDGTIYLLEPNPNPDLAADEEFAQSAASVGIDYEQLIQRVLNLGFSYQAGWKEE